MHHGLMAQYDVYRDGSGSGYLLDIQSDFVTAFGTRLVVPLLPEARVPPPTRKLHPVFRIDDGQYVMATQLMAAVSATMLKDRVETVVRHHIEITDAVDFLLHGY